MPNSTQTQFLGQLKQALESKLKQAGITDVAVETFEETGEPRAKLSGNIAQLFKAKAILRSYEAMLVLAPEDCP